MTLTIWKALLIIATLRVDGLRKMKSTALRFVPYVVIVLLIIEVVLLIAANPGTQVGSAGDDLRGDGTAEPGDSIQTVGFQTMDGKTGELSYTDLGKKYLLFYSRLMSPL